jgi:hypothetical protein
MSDEAAPSLAHAASQEPPPPAPKTAKKEPAPPEKPDIRKGLLELARSRGLVGLPLLQAAAQLNIPAPWGVALSRVAFAVNTGLAGHKAAEGLRKSGAEGTVKVVESCLEKDEPDVVAYLRTQFPEK